MADRQRNGDESFLREIWEGLRRRERGGGRPARGSTRGPVAAAGGDAPGGVSTPGQDSH